MVLGHMCVCVGGGGGEGITVHCHCYLDVCIRSQKQRRHVQHFEAPHRRLDICER